MQTADKDLRQTPATIHSTFAVSLYAEKNFFRSAEALREQFEKQVLSSGGNRGLSAFVYAFRENSYQFLTSSADRIFTAGILEEFIESLKAWAANTLGVSHVSAPQVRGYIHGCSRAFLCDEVSFEWHYSFCLTKRLCHHKTARIKLLVESIEEEQNRNFSIDRIVTLQPELNDLVVHRAGNPYSIETGTKSMSPLEADILLDGYLW
ncbi:MAG TPA: hypothetical protein VKZ53_30605 [Candidatus Angelobacter sp.]|nr:hypothetical protein [Candidatus Angelobacter sp.]